MDMVDRILLLQLESEIDCVFTIIIKHVWLNLFSNLIQLLTG